MSGHQVSFGDHVRIRSTALTDELGFARLMGTVYGETTPSISRVNVIGEGDEDRAVNVFFEDSQEGLWFAPSLVEFLDYAPGQEVTLRGVPKKWVRSANGEWEEIEINQRPWWKFWG